MSLKKGDIKIYFMDAVFQIDPIGMVEILEVVREYKLTSWGKK